MDIVALWEEEISAQQEAAIYNFYGDTSINEGVTDVLKSLIEKIRKALLALIDKIDEMLGNAKNSKFKSTLKSLLSRAKSCLSRTNDISSKEEARDVAKEANNIKDEAKGISEEFKKAVEKNDVMGIRLLVKNQLIIDPTGYTSDNMIKYATDNGVNIWDEDDGKGRKNITSKDDYNYATTEIMSNFSKIRYNALKRGAKYLFLEDHSKDKDDDKAKRLSEEFKKAVESGNVLRIRIMIKDSMLLDKTFYLSDNEVKYAINNGIDLWEKDDDYGRKAITSEDALNEALVEFVSNFSKTRYNEIKRGIKYLYLEDHSKDEDDDEDYL